MSSGAVQLRRIVVACEGYRMAIDAVFGIGHTESQVLSRLALHGELSPRELGDALGLTSGSVTNLLDRLEAAGLVRRRPHPGDRRRLIVSSTDRSRAIIAASNDQYDAMLEALSSSDPTDADSFLAGLADALDAAAVRLGTLAGDPKRAPELSSTGRR